MINICIYEDSIFNQLLPLTFSRPAYDLLLGTERLTDKVTYYYPKSNITLHCRDYLGKLVKTTYPKYAVNIINTGAPCLFLNGRVTVNSRLVERIAKEEKDRDLLLTHRGQVVALYLSGEKMSDMKERLEKIPDNKSLIEHFRPICLTQEIEDVTIISNVWDLINHNSEIIRNDFNRFGKRGIIKGDVKPLTAFYNENNIYVEKGAEIEDFVVLDATHGPIFIDKGAKIEAHSRLHGPLYIGKNSTILGGKIRNCTIGPNCKIGGEVNSSIFYGYSNKSHDGFIGHSYIGEWVNMGALTTNSNLKNNYKPVKIIQGANNIQSPNQFLGAIVGDHVKTGIGTLLNTGSIIGYGSSICGAALHSRYIPPFSWGTSGRYTLHALDKFFDTAEIMMNRRKIELHPDHKTVIELLHDSAKSAHQN
ncbi:MAG: putative sugar nucleotidyl transferase [bacterium]|nr:putative sugar nucleotidyl transferase [bacterium]